MLEQNETLLILQLIYLNLINTNFGNEKQDRK